MSEGDEKPGAGAADMDVDCRLRVRVPPREGISCRSLHVCVKQAGTQQPGVSVLVPRCFTYVLLGVTAAAPLAQSCSLQDEELVHELRSMQWE